MPFVSVILFFLSSSLSALTIVGTSNRSGELEPCGCQVNQIGGINRLDEWLKTSRKKEETLVLDAGDTFFSSPLVSESRKEMELLRSKVIADAYKEMGVIALTPGERDLAFGLKKLQELSQRGGFKLVASNVSGKQSELFEKEWVIETKQGAVGILGVVLAETFSEEAGLTVEDPFEALAKGYSSLEKKKVKRIVILSHLGLNEDRKILEKFKNVLIIGSHSLDPVVEKHKGNNSVVAQPKHEGQEIIVSSGKETKLVELPKDLDKENNVAKIVRHYHEMRGTVPDKNAVATASTKHPFVANPHKCKGCHEEQYGFWEGTKHSSAILVLYSKRQHLDSDCIRCHSLGFREPGGFPDAKAALKSNKGAKGEAFLAKLFEGQPEGALDSRLDPVRHQKLHEQYHEMVHEGIQAKKIQNIYWGVQCEHCHGNRHGHPGALTQKKVSAQTCVQCHRPPNAPEFDPALIPKVACPLMKKKGAE